MKIKILLLTMTAVLTMSVNAQITPPEMSKQIIRFSPLSLAKLKSKIHYEYAGFGYEKLSFGAQASYFFGIYPGLRIAPFGRYYFLGKNGEGLYSQAKMHYSSNSIEYSGTKNNVPFYRNEKFNEWGAGLAIGYQFLFGAKKNFAVDLWAGYRYSKLMPLDKPTIATNWDQLIDEIILDVIKTGYQYIHSNQCDLGISIGYAF